MMANLFIYKSGKETVAEQLASYLRQVADAVQIEMEKQLTINAGSNQKPASIDQVGGTFGNMMASIESYYANRATKNITGINAAVTKATQKLEELKAKLEITHSENIPKIENNRLMRSALVNFMETINIPGEYSTFEYPTSRSTSRKERKHKSGWIEDMARILIIDDGYSLAITKYNKYLVQIKQYELDEIKAIEDREAKVITDKLNKERDKVLAVLIARYNLSFETNSFETILSRISREDSMLRLSYYFKFQVDNLFYMREDLLDELDELNLERKEYHLVVEKIKAFVTNNGNTSSIKWNSNNLLEECLNEVAKNDYLTCIKYINNGK